MLMTSEQQEGTFYGTLTDHPTKIDFLLWLHMTGKVYLPKYEIPDWKNLLSRITLHYYNDEETPSPSTSSKFWRYRQEGDNADV